ncbi:MAG: FliM/FliN family flagellar motor switch protein [Phycisphaerales bacterium]
MRGSNTEQVLRLEVPVVVLLGERQMTVNEILGLLPGSIIELPKNAESELDLIIANKPVGCGFAVKVGENFGIRLSYVGDPATRLTAAMDASSEGGDGGVSAEELAAAMLAGQI